MSLQFFDLSGWIALVTGAEAAERDVDGSDFVNGQILSVDGGVLATL